MREAGRGSPAVDWLRRFAALLAMSALIAPAAWGSFAYTGQGRLEILSNQVSWRPDDGGTADVPSLLADEAGWKSQAKQPAEVSRGPVALWARFDIPAATAESSILVSSAPWERIDFYVVQERRVVAHELVGTLVPFEERSLPLAGVAAMLRPGFAPVHLAAGVPTTVVARLQTHNRYSAVSALAFSIWDPGRTMAAERSDRFIQGLFYGLMLFLILYNFCLFVVTREASYLYYVVLELGMTTTSAILFGQAFEFLWPDHPVWDHYGSWVATAIGGFGMGQFLRQYLDTKRQFPRIDRVLRWYACFALVIIPVPFVIPLTTDALAMILFGSTPLTVALIGTVLVHAWRTHHPLAGNLVGAMAWLCVGFLLYVATFLEILPVHAVTVHATQIGSAVMGIILSLGIGLRMRRMHDELARNERDRLAQVESQKLELERQVAERTAELAGAREKSEALLGNILPRPIIDELAANGVVEPRRHEEATILFTDFAGFTGTVATIPARRLVQELDEIFRAFDEIVAGFGLEKIKTIGDAYMAAAGLPLPATDHAQRCVAAGAALCRYIEQRNEGAALKWGLRVGVHSGAVVAGVVGKHKYAYDVWGDTVNIASRLESAGQPGKVNISAYTYELVRDFFDCDYRGKVTAKGKGEIDMYFLRAPKSAAAVPA